VKNGPLMNADFGADEIRIRQEENFINSIFCLILISSAPKSAFISGPFFAAVD